LTGAGSGPVRAAKAVALLAFDAAWLYVAGLMGEVAVAGGTAAVRPVIAPLLVLSGVSLFAASGLYRPDSRPPMPTQAVRIGLCMLLLASAVMVANHLNQPAAGALPAGLAPAWAALGGAGAGLARLGWYLAVRHRPAAAANPAFIVGTLESVREVLAERDRDPDAATVPAGVFLLSGRRSLAQVAGVPVLGRLADLPDAVRESGVETVLIAVRASDQQSQETVLDALAPLDVDGHLLLTELLPASAADRHESFGPFRTVRVQARPLRDGDKLVKRIFDLVAGGIATLLAAPVLLAAAVAIKLDTPGPVLFRQPRYGYNDALVTIYKFRTMYHTAADTRARRATRPDDPRVTPVGRLLRRTSLDELPQLFNVLQGRMSMVGPRPHAPESMAGGWYFHDAVTSYAARHRVKPGITGAAQVSGWRGPTETQDKLERRVDYDLWYLHNWSLALDVRILLRTPFALMGANTF
jgi:exopolysaccharide biosynthesis polyprenyl glycosylphosphotransferase